MIRLLLGDTRQEVDTEDISKIDIKYSLKDIKNYSQRNISYTKPITILKTKKTEEIFKGLYNINVLSDFNIGQFIDAELVENGITILKGVLEITEWENADYYKGVVTSPQFNLFNKMGDSLIVGNTNINDDILFSKNAYAFTYNNNTIRTQLKENIDNVTLGQGYRFVLVDYDNTINTPEDIENNYLILPAIAAKEVWNAIFNKYGFTYNLSKDIETYLDHMYIPYNGNYLDKVQNFQFGKYTLGQDNYLVDWGSAAGTPPSYVYPELLKYKLIYYTNNGSGNYASLINTDNWSTFEKNAIQGSIYTSTWKTNDYDNLINNQSNDGSYVNSPYIYNVVQNGIYNMNVNLTFGYAYNYDYFVEDDEFVWVEVYPVDMNIDVVVVRGGVEFTRTNIGTVTTTQVYNATNNKFYFQGVINDLDLKIGDEISIVVLAKDDLYKNDEATRRLAVLYDANSNFEITLQNSLLNTHWELNDLRPLQYKQKDIINDIFKMFNVFVEVDKNDNNKLYIKSYNEYYKTPVLNNWTDKLDQESIKVKPIKNTFAKETIFTNSDDDDIYNKDFKDKYNYTFGTKRIINDSEFSNESNVVELSIPSTIITTVKES